MNRLGAVFTLSLFFCFVQWTYSQEIDINDPGLIFKNEKNQVLTKDSAQRLMDEGLFRLKTKDLGNGKKEVIIIPVSKEALQSHDNIGLEFINKWKGKKFPLIDLKDMEGHAINNNSFKNKLVVINFWFINCKPCVNEIPELNKLVKKYIGKPVLFIAPSLDDHKALSDFLKKHDFQYDILPNAKGLAEEIGLRIYPAHIIIDKKGTVKEILFGGSDDIFETLDALINQEMH